MSHDMEQILADCYRPQPPVQRLLPMHAGPFRTAGNGMGQSVRAPLRVLAPHKGATCSRSARVPSGGEYSRFCPQFRALIPKSQSTCPATQCYACFNGGKMGWSPTPRALRAPPDRAGRKQFPISEQVSARRRQILTRQVTL
jgi:hypothetical protein